MAANTPRMDRAASEIDNPHELFERVGYRVFLDWRAGREPKLYLGFNDADLRQLQKLLPGEAGQDREGVLDGESLG